jgi:hypothetical protein
VESREGKAERVYFKEREKDMQSGDEGQTQWEKENEPIRWLEYTSEIIDKMMIEYNNVAFEQGEDVIMAFKMTAEEYAEATKEALDEATEGKTDS